MKQFLLKEIQKLAKRFTHIGQTISPWKRTKEPETLIIKPIHTAQKHATRRKFPTLQLFPEKLRVWTQHLIPHLLTKKVTVLDEFARLHSVYPSRHSTERTDRNIHLPVFPWKRHICQLQKLLPEGQASNLTHVEAVIPPKKLGITGGAISMFSLWPTTGHQFLLRGSLCIHLVPQFLQQPPGDIPLIAWLW